MGAVVSQRLLPVCGVAVQAVRVRRGAGRGAGAGAEAGRAEQSERLLLQKHVQDQGDALAAVLPLDC